MDFRQLRYFIEIADFGNMTRASESLHIAQPALTQQIANLESELGTRVFERSTQGMRLTAAGDVLYRHAKSVLKQLEDARTAVQDEQEHPSGGVSIGIPGSVGKVVAVPLMRTLAAYERVLPEIVERPSAELLSLVARGRLDLAVVVDAAPSRGVEIAPLLTEKLFVITDPASSRGRRTLSLREIAGQPLILPAAPSTIRLRLDAAFTEARLALRVVGEVSTTDMLVRMVAAGLGWTVLPWSAVGEEVRAGLVSALPVAGCPLSRELSICTSAAVPLSRAAEVVHGLLRGTLEKAARSRAWAGVERIKPATD